MVGLRKARKNQAVWMGGYVGTFHLIKQMLGYAAAPALLSSGEGMFDHFGHHERVRRTMTLHCSRQHGEHGAFSKLLFLGFLQSDKRLFAEADQLSPRVKAT